MKTCGIEIDNDKAIIVSLEQYDNNIEICEHSTKIILKDNENSDSIKDFADLIHSQLDTIGASRIGIVKRQTRGPYAAGALSFKIEGIIQCYREIDIELIAPATIKAFLRKNPRSINPIFKYQENALNAALYLLKK